MNRSQRDAMADLIVAVAGLIQAIALLAWLAN